MNTPWKTMIWEQFGAVIGMLENALHACPDDLWRDNIWHDPTDAPEYTEFWFVIYHSLFWLDLYLSGSRREDFVPPAPFVKGKLPEEPYTKDQLQTYLHHCYQECEAICAGLTDEKANQRCEFPWGEEVSFAELQIYNMRHVQEHAAQLSLYLGQNGVAAPDWVARAAHKSS